MGKSQFDPVVQNSIPWNAGRAIRPKRPLKPRDVWAIRLYLGEHHRRRDRALFDLALDSKLRGGDVVKIRIGDVVADGTIRKRATVVQQKTGRRVGFPAISLSADRPTSRPIASCNYFCCDRASRKP
jgi:integrase